MWPLDIKTKASEYVFSFTYKADPENIPEFEIRLSKNLNSGLYKVLYTGAEYSLICE